MLEQVKRLPCSIKKKHNKILAAGTCVVCNGINMTKKCLCACNENCPYDPFIAGLLITMCPKDDKSITKYIDEYVD